jgi:hypothetical protein
MEDYIDNFFDTLMIFNVYGTVEDDDMMRYFVLRNSANQSKKATDWKWRTEWFQTYGRQSGITNRLWFFNFAYFSSVICHSRVIFGVWWKSPEGRFEWINSAKCWVTGLFSISKVFGSFFFHLSPFPRILDDSSFKISSPPEDSSLSKEIYHLSIHTKKFLAKNFRIEDTFERGFLVQRRRIHLSPSKNILSCPMELF